MAEFTIKDNTVSAENQIKNLPNPYYLGEEKDNSYKILILGNSITRHGPLSEIGWENDWGMAASALEKDFVHILFEKLELAKKLPYFMVRSASKWETSYLNEGVLSSFEKEKAFNPDVIVFRLGENVVDVKNEEQKIVFAQKIAELINYIGTKDTKIVYTTCFWENELVDEAIRLNAKEKGCLVELCDLGKESTMRADGLFWHAGVAGHPGDKGMQAIAERIFESLK